ncbi:MAG: hypothetical protein O3A10_00615 [Chloroflexi bacterium]|nr:hypothetical protein [Chloroflexota bacterium]MDA1148134.1 hypothetical protein [Chloroflexota bacterium]
MGETVSATGAWRWFASFAAAAAGFGSQALLFDEAGAIDWFLSTNWLVGGAISAVGMVVLTQAVWELRLGRWWPMLVVALVAPMPFAVYVWPNNWVLAASHLVPLLALSASGRAMGVPVGRALVFALGGLALAWIWLWPASSIE